MSERAIRFRTNDNRRNDICNIIITTSINNYFATQQTIDEKNCYRFLRDCFKESLGGYRRTHYKTVESGIITFSQVNNKSEDRPKFIIIKNKRSYYINGDKVSLKNLVGVFINLITRWPTFVNHDDVDECILNYLEMSPEISHALINKISYKFITENGDIETTLLNIQLTGNDSVAIELYTDMWIDFTCKEVLMFIRACKTGNNKYGCVSYQELYYMQMGELLTTSEEKLVEAFLIQNRASNLVTRRSMELVDKLSRQFKNIVKLRIYDHNNPDEIQQRGLYVKGKGRWFVYHSYDEGQHILGRQNVVTSFVHHIVPPLNFSNDLIEAMLENNYFIVQSPENPNHTFSVPVGSLVLTDGKNLYHRGGNICIDQSDDAVSLGDQIASRAMVLLHDYKNIQTVSTLRGMESNLGYSNFEEKYEGDEDEVLSLRYTQLTREHLETLVSQSV